MNPTAETWERLGLVRHLQNKFEPAIPAFEQAVRLDPRRWTSHLFLGICLYRTNQFERALAALLRADGLAGKAVAGRDDLDYWLAASHIATKKRFAGLKVLERLLARNPSHADALELAVRTYADANTSAWNEVGEKHPETPAGYEVLGHALESEGNREGALAAFRQAKALQPKRAGPGLAIGRLLLQQGKVEEALVVLRQETAWRAPSRRLTITPESRRPNWDDIRRLHGGSRERQSGLAGIRKRRSHWLRFIWRSNRRTKQ